ncbi:hypothetical protein [Lacticaseibacillus sharpeae]|uniref:Uncharacterized protein n=1 Tax=Lacticaseibacillus sharpeae JCM 1186 = DSM 20505 TaxID=1291052 RepID=A0A0R1ZIX6_9LACO|nr:hypothetical protein [Lacticaseibacillus sharpeae]KRM54389.1 hypothetical protein FC18_GL000610 [Lacticaseibacillus sharpeae JCM 1186 = DSM 20505]
MLDERLLGTTFTLKTDADTGSISLYGIHYHYRVVGLAVAGDLVAVTQVTPLELVVRRAVDLLEY